MSSSRDFSGGRRQGKEPEKSSFVQTCNLLSRYIKEKGSLRDLNLEIAGKVESLEAIVKPGSSQSASAFTTMNILTDKGKSAQLSTEQQPSMAADSAINIVEDESYKPTSKEATTTTKEPKTAQLTIFYSGRVLVFDDYQAEKAKELVAFAKKNSSQMSYGILLDTMREKPNHRGAVASTSSTREGFPPRSQAIISPKAVDISSNTCKGKTNAAAMASSSRTEEGLSPQPEANGSDLPIARRSSLHRFLEKRKDRAAGRGPYQVQERPDVSSEGDEQLELKL